MLNVSSTVTPCGPSACTSISVRPRHGRISASRPCIRWLRLSLVLICTVSSQFRNAAWVRGVSGVAWAKLPPRPMNTLARPSSIALIASTALWPCSRGTLNWKRRSRASSRRAGGCSSMPMVRSPCTLLWPRTGDNPAPGRPTLPRSSCRLMTSWMVGTEWRCWVRPMAQHMITRSALRYMNAASSISERLRPDCSTMCSQLVASTSAR
ncbi:hypothetical protein D3C80_1256490 [compost metagenome]